MKKQLIALTLIFVLTLTACSKGEAVPDTETASAPSVSAEDTAELSAPESDASDDETAQADTENTENTYPTAAFSAVPEEDYPDCLYGPGGDKISVDEITEVKYYDLNPAEKWDYAGCDGFTYLAEPTGISFNMDENPELLDSENFTFSGAPESSAEYKRYRVGDSICGLTVKEASVDFSTDMVYNHREGYFKGGTVSFDGSLELTGYLIVLADYEYDVGDAGDIVFILDNESQILPIMNYNAISEEKGVHSTLPDFCRSVAGFAYQSEYPFALCFLENIEDYGLETFEPNTPVRVKITARDISMYSRVEWLTGLTMTIKVLELL